MTETCFHCGDPVPPGLDLPVRFEGVDQPMCCAGCQAVAELIIGSGQSDYYRFRQGEGERVDEQLLDRLADWDAFASDPEPSSPGSLRRSDVLVEGIHCAACGWLIETQLNRLDGVTEVAVDILGRELQVAWDQDRIALADILRRLVQLGYRPHPGSDEHRISLHRREQRAALRRLGVAGLGMMQVMMYAAGTYFGSPDSLSPAVHRFLDLVSMLVATPVVLYAGAPFFTGALRALAGGRVNVDVPVALALTLAFGASCRNLMAGEGTVYFDSVSMFVFFLLLGRFVEMMVRQRSIVLGDGLSRLLPDVALRLAADGEHAVPRSALITGDQVRVRHGEAFPVDGRIVEGTTAVDESLLTGESRPIDRGPGQEVLAGSVNQGQPVVVEARATGEETAVSHMGRMLGRARSQRPPSALQADRIAAGLVAGILLLAVVTYGLWLPHDPALAFQALLAVLVVTCPCAFSLATPSALAAASVNLSRRGLLICKGDAVDQFGQVDRVVLDKTGTLTLGRPRLREVRALTERATDTQELLACAAALERGAIHPVAHALRTFDEGLPVDQVQIEPGAGVCGTVNDQQLALGSASFVARHTGQSVPELELPETALGAVWLADGLGPLAVLLLDDPLRSDASETVRALGDAGVTGLILSGDQPAPVARTAMTCGILDWQAGLKPEDKLAQVHGLQAAGHRVMAVGDGVNDAPVLAGADVSVALGSGAGLARSGADAVLLGESLSPLVDAVNVGRRTRRIIRQNLTWALGYNLLAVPLAAMGWVHPWMAAIGMSVSSLVVVLNAARLSRPTRRSSIVESAA